MSLPHQLTFVEEVVLLALDDHTGSLRHMPPLSFSYALAGALIGDLAMLNRIDTDPDRLFVIDSKPTGDSLLDDALARITAETKSHPVAHWLTVFSQDSHRLEKAALERLASHGILRVEEKKILWVFGVRRYPVIDNHESTEVKTRLSALILGDDLPDPRDAVLVSLLSSCHLISHVFPGAEHAERSKRIESLARMDQIGREVSSAVNRLTHELMAMNLIGL